MKRIWWMLIIAMVSIFYFLGHERLQISNFKVFIIVFYLTILVALFIFWFFARGKDPLNNNDAS
jgi:hypothetical protein